MIAATGRSMFFKNVWASASDVIDNLSGQVGRLKITIETDTGHRLVELPLEIGDEEFARVLLTGVLQMAAAKCAAAAPPAIAAGSIDEIGRFK